jgi:hypothetical protein
MTQGCCSGQIYNLATRCCVSGTLADMCGGDGDCCPAGLSCCGKECYDPAAKHCCEDPTGGYYTCDNGNVCCYDAVFGIDYCPTSCTETTDTTSCSKDNESSYNGCYGCQQVTAPTCGTYREYTGNEITTCNNGCPDTDWNQSNPDCYYVRQCFPMLHPNSWCSACKGETENSCKPVSDLGSGGNDCQNIVDCVVQCDSGSDCIIKIVCTVVTDCFQCEQSVASEVITTVPASNCSCN